MQHTPRSLIANEGYEAAWTQLTEFFNQPLPALADGSAAPLPNTNPTAEYPWASRGYPIVIPQNINTKVPLLLEDNYRCMMIFQNNSVAPTAGDVAPNLFISLDGPVQFVTLFGQSFAYNALTLVPQEGLLLDTRVLGNSIFVAWGVPTGNPFVFGMCVYARTLNAPPQPPNPPSLMPIKRYFGAGGAGNTNTVKTSKYGGGG